MTEIFRNYQSVSPSDTAKIQPTVGLYIGGAGDLAVVGREGSAATFAAVPAGMTLWIEVVQIKATGTTATAIVALR